MRKIILSLIFCLLLLNIAKSQNYFPLKIGNKFVYFYQWYRYTPIGSGSGSRMLSMKITDTTTINDKKYFKCSGIPYIVEGWVRVDSITGSLYKYTSSNICPYYYYETLVDSLGIISPGLQNNCSSIYFQGKSNDSLFGIPSSVKHYSRINMLDNSYKLSGETHRYYNEKFGFKYLSSTYESTQTSSTDILILKGCCINGNCYGDTTGISIGINIISQEVPSNFHLTQNYPNPFNHSSIFKFQCSKKGHVNISVYDITGREVRMLVNETLQPGTYEVRFDGSELNSGVYFVRMTAGEYTDTKRMVLLK